MIRHKINEKGIKYTLVFDKGEVVEFVKGTRIDVVKGEAFELLADDIRKPLDPLNKTFVLFSKNMVFRIASARSIKEFEKILIEEGDYEYPGELDLDLAEGSVSVAEIKRNVIPNSLLR